MKVHFFSNYPDLIFDTEKNDIIAPSERWSTSKPVTIGKFLFLRFLKNKYSNKPRFESNFINEMRRAFADEMPTEVANLLDFFQENYDMVEPYSYQEAFECPWAYWKSVVFSSIRVSDMIKELGHTRIATSGRPVRHKQFSKSGKFLGYHEYDVIFETHQVDGRKLNLTNNIFAVRCWCTTTNNEHWLWIDRQYSEDPLEAIARTFFVHENLIPFIKELKRQGDILLVELTQDVEPRGQMVSLSKDQYFELLTAQS
tara:strand:- start:173 stop:940 length:768 start_codon:yes stop_codon:yes gene_type:complete